jgi:hypothetical protein
MQEANPCLLAVVSLAMQLLQNRGGRPQVGPLASLLDGMRGQCFPALPCYEYAPMMLAPMHMHILARSVCHAHERKMFSILQLHTYC